MATAPKTHRPLNSGPPREEYDKRRGSASERGYDAAWHKLREIKVKQNPLCEDCEQDGLTVIVNEVDHIIPISGRDDPLRLDMENLRSMCKTCHTRKTKNDSYIRSLFDSLIGQGIDHEGARDAVVERAKNLR